MISLAVLPTISLLCVVAQAGNAPQHPFRTAIQPLANACHANTLTNSDDLCLPVKHDPYDHHGNNHQNHANPQSQNHLPSHQKQTPPPPVANDFSLDDLFDDFEDPDTANPWTHTPECIPDNETNQTYCVYTNANYANGRGISFFTTPKIAKYVTTLPAFTGGSLPENVNQFTDVPYEIRSMPGRGNGMFATRDLQRGDIILAETPVGVYMSDAFFPDYEVGYEYLRKTYDWLPEKTQEEFEKLSTYNEGHPIMERVNTNSFSGAFGDDAHFWIHPQTAMLNHDCRPNAMYHTNEETFVHTTVASTEIKAGEEITITYINLLENQASRAELLRIWGFNCSCSLCTGSKTQNLASEARVAQIVKLQAMLSDWSFSSSGSPEVAEKLIKLYARENLHAAKGTGHMFAALAYNALGEEGNTMERMRWHAQMAIEAGAVGSGEFEKDMEEMRSLLERPKKHWSWGARKKGMF